MTEQPPGDLTIVTAPVVFIEHLALPTAPVRSAAAHPATVYLSGLSAGTSQRTMTQALTKLAQYLGYPDFARCPWEALRFPHVAALRARLVADLGPASGRKHVAALRGVLLAAWRLNLIPTEDYHRAIDIAPIRAADTADAAERGRALSTAELQRLLATCAADPAPDGARDVAIFSLGYGLGLRRSDLVALDLASYTAATASLAVRGKGNKTAILPVAGNVQHALRGWLAVRGHAPGPLFYRVRAHGHLVPTRLTNQAIYDIVQRRTVEAQLAPFTPHDLRRTFAGDLLDLGVDLATVQRLMRHADPKTTAGYDRRGGRARRAAVQHLTVPLVGYADEPLAADENRPSRADDEPEQHP